MSELRIKEENFNNRTREVNELRSLLENKPEVDLHIGAYFYYPPNHNFRDELIGKRAKIVGLNGDKVFSRLVDDDGNFIDNIEWGGSRQSALNYIYEFNNCMNFKFVK